MKGDFTRHTFDPKKRYHGVRLQQGRVGLDADFNEQAELDAFLRETALTDVIGPCGVPAEDAETADGGGFRIRVEDGDLSIAPGHVYVDGLRVELTEDDVTYLGQPDFPGAELPTDEDEGGGPGLYLVYLDAWRHHRTALEDELIREVALGGPDTATRLRTVGQVKVVRVRDRDGGFSCVSGSDAWEGIVDPNLGALQARTRSTTEPDDPCVVPSGGGYTRLENQLYRVEVHGEGGLDTATFKWSRENGSVVTSWDGQDGDELTVGTTGPDDVRGLAQDQWIELTDEGRELRGEPGLLVRIAEIRGDDKILIDPNGHTVNRADFANGPKVRRWDMTGEQGALTIERDESVNDGYLTLEGGIEVRFSGGGTRYRTGDFWWIPARAFVGVDKGEIEWPADESDPTQPAALPPHGIRHHYCRLAVVDFDGEEFTGIASDCRPRFPSLNELTRITPAGGDGQEGLPGDLLPCPLEVAVANGRRPVAGARVRFRIRGDSGQVGGNAPASFGESFVGTTNQDGLARCRWILPGDAREPSDECFAVSAHLLDADDNEVETPPVFFHATVALARRVAYEPGCDLLEELQAFTVQDALDALCRNLGEGGEEGIRVEEVLLDDGQGLENDSTHTVSTLSDGFRIRLSEPVPGFLWGGVNDLRPNPILDVTVYAPTRVFVNDVSLLGGFSHVTLPAIVGGEGQTIQWVPRGSSLGWLEQLLAEMSQFGDAGNRLLLRVTLRGNFVWSVDDANRFLDGDAFGEPQDDRVGLRLPSGDGRRGGDFSMWFWLGREQIVPGLVLTAVPIVLGNTRSISGFLSDGAGNRVPGAAIRLTGPINRTALGNADGAFTFQGLTGGTYRVTAAVPGAGSVTETVILPNVPVLGPQDFVFTPNNVPVAGIGRTFGGRLINADIRNLEDLIMASPQRLANVMNVSEDQARTFIARAVARLQGEG